MIDIAGDGLLSTVGLALWQRDGEAACQSVQYVGLRGQDNLVSGFDPVPLASVLYGNLRRDGMSRWTSSWQRREGRATSFVAFDACVS